MASIGTYYLKDGTERWFFQIYSGRDAKTGKKGHILRRGFESEMEARHEATIMEAEILKGNAGSVGRRITMARYLNDWITKYKKNVKEGTLIVHRYNISHYIVPKIGGFQLSKYSLADHQEFISSLFDDGLSQSTVRLVNGTVHNALKKAMSMGYLEKNPVDGAELGRRNIAGKKLHFWSKDQVGTFIEACRADREPMWLSFFLLMIDTGLRVGEAMALQWSDIDFKANTVNVNKTRLYRAETGENRKAIMIDQPKTASSKRIVLITKRERKELLNLYSLRYDQSGLRVLPGNTAKNEDFVFCFITPARFGQPLRARAASTAFTRLVKRSGLPKIRVHDLRHTHAVLMRESGLSLDDIKDELGHKDVSTTEIYAEISPAKRQTNHDQYEKFLNEN